MKKTTNTKSEVINRVVKEKRFREKQEAHPIVWAVLEKFYLYPTLTIRVFMPVFAFVAVLSTILGYTIHDTLLSTDEADQKTVYLMFCCLCLFIFGLEVVTKGKIAADMEYTVKKETKTATAASILSLLAVLALAISSGIEFTYDLFLYWVKEESLLSFAVFILTLVASRIIPKLLARHAYGFLPVEAVVEDTHGTKSTLYRCPLCKTVVQVITAEPPVGRAERKQPITENERPSYDTGDNE